MKQLYAKKVAFSQEIVQFPILNLQKKLQILNIFDAKELLAIFYNVRMYSEKRFYENVLRGALAIYNQLKIHGKGGGVKLVHTKELARVLTVLTEKMP